MQTEVNGSNEHLFENEFCLVSAEGALKQKDNSLFSGKILEENVTAESAGEKASGYEAAFTRLRESVHERLGAINESLDAAKAGEVKDEFLTMLKEADAVGDFDALHKEIQDALKEKATSDEQKKDQPEEETPKAEAEKSDKTDQPAEEAEASVETEKPASEEPKEETPEAPEEETKAEPSGEKDDSEAEEKKDDAGEETDTEAETDPEKYYKNLVKDAREAAELKNLKQATSTYDKLKADWEKGPEFDHVDYYKLKDKFEEIQPELDKRRMEHQRQQEERRKKNLAFREELLDRMQKIIDDKKWSAQGEMNNLTRKFENVKPLPADGVKEQAERLKSLTTVFEENRVEYLVEVREKEQQNLMGKLVVAEKMDALVNQAGAETEDWEALNNEFEKLTRDWKKIGHVPREKENEVWDRYHKTREKLTALRMEHDKAYGKEIEKNIARREKLIERAEKLTEADSLAEASREINHLHSEWKKSGPVPQQTHDELWTRFKSASDAFNKIRDEHSDEIRKEEEKNLEIKLKLIERAEKLAESEDRRGSKNEMDALLEEWKKVGPVPRKKARGLWRNFRKTRDTFYKERRKHFRDVREEQNKNLKARRDIIDRIEELASAEDIEAAHEDVKKMQEEFKSIGFVPIKQKDKIWDLYHKACDKFFSELRSRGARSSGGPAPKSGKVSEDKKITGEMFRLRKEVDELRDQVLKYSDTKTYFKPNKKGQKLIDEIQSNIDQAEQRMEEKEKRIRELQQQLNESRSKADSDGEANESKKESES